MNDTVLSSKQVTTPSTAGVAAGVAAEDVVVVVEGCYICHLNNHQNQILLCDHCNGEYHIYCLQPPLLSIPENGWYCRTSIS
jgi:PHD-finger